jgi:hypothetical protein
MVKSPLDCTQIKLRQFQLERQNNKGESSEKDYTQFLDERAGESCSSFQAIALSAKNHPGGIE